ISTESEQEAAATQPAAKPAAKPRPITVPNVNNVEAMEKALLMEEDRSYRLVVKNLASTTPQNFITLEFHKLGHTVVNAYNPPSR
ncbi:hypothetical protein KR059_005311, partial [Drosophila kikkawai]